jgi:hypothetical protein
VRARLGQEPGRAVEVMSCYEVRYDGFWLHRQLKRIACANYVIDPASLQVDRRARRAKTDRIDAERLLRSLMAYLRGEPKLRSLVRVLSVADLPTKVRNVAEAALSHLSRLSRCSAGTSVRDIARSSAVDRLRRGQAAGPALQDEGLLTRHAPDDGQEPHRLAAYGTEEVIVAEVHGGSVQAGVRPSVSTSGCGRERRRPSSGRPRIAPHGSSVCRDETTGVDWALAIPASARHGKQKLLPSCSSGRWQNASAVGYANE